MTAQVKGEEHSKSLLEIPVLTRLFDRLKQLIQVEESADYKAWRHQFMVERLRLTTWIAFLCYVTLSLHSLFIVLVDDAQFKQDVLRIYNSSEVVVQLRNTTVAASLVGASLLIGCLFLQKTKWAHQNPIGLFLMLSWSLTMSEHLVATYFRVPVTPDAVLVFMGQAVLIPICWRIHLISQLLPIAYFAIVNPMLGITRIGDRSIYDSYIIGVIVGLFWVCLICDLGVFLYERLKRSEFESQRRLRVFLHSISHDLRNPVMGTSIVLQNLLKETGQKILVDRSVLERLLQGGDRQLNLINSLLEAHATEVQGIPLHPESIQLSELVGSVLSDLAPLLQQNQVKLCDRTRPDLPPINGDKTQLWRVLTNLITNALKHNPPGIELTLEAKLVAAAMPPGINKAFPLNSSRFQWIRCTIQDNGVGISPRQSHSLFELYSRGSRARYMPGLGLGLYLCKQIINAHGGQIGVISQPGEGSTFWFTLPISSLSEDS